MGNSLRCPSCSSAVGEGESACPACGTAVPGSDDTPTGTAPRPTPPRADGGSRGPRSGSSARTQPRSGPGAGGAAGRFAPGEVLAGRYRIVGLLGRGGMGEVYRADDLTLGQAVALKLLPEALARDPDRLERFFNEVRVARQVTHPSVCRVYDLGEAEGAHFLSMEYVDGENLASLLRRIGRLPPAKALEIARQVADGLGEAHARGVLHRDLKPENVMLDGEGRARITDFGLAGLAESFSGDEVRSGTPAYMAPEQLAGREVSARSDVFSLGLVVYELVTGRRAFAGRSLAELLHQHQQGGPPAPSDLVPDLDPAVERVIQRCLDPDPRRRPPSARVVAGMLSGQDALAATVAAGETPSPELVAAAAGEGRAMPLPVAWACLALVLLAAAAAPFVLPHVDLLRLQPLRKPVAVLEDRARTLVRELGHPDPEADSATGFAADRDHLRHVEDTDASPGRWEGLKTGEPPVARFWFRQSSRPMVPVDATSVTRESPPPWISGMAGVELDLGGRLLAYHSVPPQREGEDLPPPGDPDWSRLFAEARLDPGRMQAVEPRWTPPFYCDRRAAWEGTWPERPDLPLRVEAAAYRGRPVSFLLVQPWTRPERMAPARPASGELLAQAVQTAFVLLLVAGGGVMARRHLALGQGDRPGAARVAVFTFVVGIAGWACEAHHVRDRNGEMGLMVRGVASALLLAAVLWVFYLALEPHARRLWPHTLISWARLLGGGWRDPRVGRDLLVGLAWGVLLAGGILAGLLLPAWLGEPPPAPGLSSYGSLLGVRAALVPLAEWLLGGMVLGLGALLTLLLARLLLRNERAAVACLVAALTLIQVLSMPGPLWARVPLGLYIMGGVVLVLLRFGVLSTIAGAFVTNLLLASPLTTEAFGWAGGPTVVAVGLTAGLALWSFRVAAGPRLRPPAGS